MSTNYKPDSSYEPPLTETIDFSEDLEVLLRQLDEAYKKVARKVNNKERALYPLLEIINDQQFFTSGNPQKYRSVFRKVFEVGAIAAGATLNTAHNIDTIGTITRLYGMALTAVPDERPMPFADVTLVTNQILLARNGVNIVIVNGATAPNITSGIVVIEYTKT